MSGKFAGRILAGIFAAAVCGIPAEAQNYYSTIEIDPSNGTIWGAAVTELSYEYYYGWAAYASGSLNGPFGNMDNAEAYDNGTGTAEADLYSAASSAGTYYVEGQHYMFAGEYWDYLGDSYDAAQYAACKLPTSESSSDVGWNGTYGLYYRLFHATVSDNYGTSFAGRQGYEEWGGGTTYDTCPNGSYLPSQMSGNNFTFGGDNGYNDTVGESAGTVAVARGGQYPISPCGFYVYQNMYMMCPNGQSYNYWTNVLEVNIYPTTMNIYRGNAGGTYPF